MGQELPIRADDALARFFGRFDRHEIEGFVSIAIDLLDAADGDPDAEADDRGGETVAIVADPDLPPDDEGEDPDLEQTRDEDDWFDHGGSGAGCPVGDPGGAGVHEDDEDDDPDTSVEDDPEGIDPEEDASVDDFGIDEEDTSEMTPDWGIDQTKPLPDAQVVMSDRLQLNRHRARIRRERCVPHSYISLSGRLVVSQHDFTLMNDPIAPSRRQLLRRKRGVPRRPRA